MIVFLQVIGGAVLVAIGTFVFWRIGQAGGIGPRMERVPGIESLVVFVVLGGWAIGGSLLVQAAISMAVN